MADILLLEAGYRNKYPPSGLMKIAYFHKYIHHDYVRFSKGPLPEEFNGKKWDRVYVTTLFTFEWPKTKEIIEYAYSVVKDENEVYTGGILASLMPELIQSTFPKIHNNTGLLNRKGTLGLEREEEVDTLPHDYSILDDIDYVYPAHDAYFTYMTRGCGMKCQFCAVQTLEPNYIPYISIKENVRCIEREFGPKKDLLLMDNNVLRSPCFDKIVDEIKELGFQKGATYKNPKTGKISSRYVDFNQGLDAKLLTPAKAKRLGELAIFPARIAFDHIEDTESYVKAITLCAENGIDAMSNYLLYNGDDFKGKGKQYHADTPEDLYERMRISLDLGEELSQRLGRKITIFSFPMRYIPLNDLKRGYIGTKWNHKYLRAVQRMLIPTQGKGVASRSFFEAAFGKSKEEFVLYLAMPEDLLGMRGHFVEKKDESTVSRRLRRQQWEENQELISTWTKLFTGLNDERDSFIELIGKSEYTYDVYKTISSEKQKELFAFYFTLAGSLTAINKELGEGGDSLLRIVTKYPILYKRMIKHIANKRVSVKSLVPLIQTKKKVFIKDILSYVDVWNPECVFVLDNLERAQLKAGCNLFDFSVIKYLQLFDQVGIVNDNFKKDLNKYIERLDDGEIRKYLLSKLDDFKEKVFEASADEVANKYLISEIEDGVKKLYQQLSFIEDYT